MYRGCGDRNSDVSPLGPSSILSPCRSVSLLRSPRPCRSSLSPTVPLYFSHPRFSPRRTRPTIHFFPRPSFHLSRWLFHPPCLALATSRLRLTLGTFLSSLCLRLTLFRRLPAALEKAFPPSRRAGESKVSWPGEASTWGWVVARVPEGRGKPPLP